MTSQPKQVIDISPIDSSSSGKLTTFDCEAFIDGTEGEVTHGLYYSRSLWNGTSASEINQASPWTKSRTRLGPVKSAEVIHDQHSQRSQATNYAEHNNSSDNFNQI